MYKTYFQAGGQMQQEQAQGGGEEQMMQIVQQFAQIQGIDPNQIMQELQAMEPAQQEQAVQQMVQVIQQAASGQEQGMQQASPEQQAPMMQFGGMTAQDIYIMGVMDSMKKVKKSTKKKKDGGIVHKEEFTFQQAFARARNMGKTSFKYEGKEHSTKFSFEN